MFSVVITAYNCQQFLHQALKSVFSQTLKPKEVIVVDDASKDDTPLLLEEFSKKYPLKVLKNQENRERCFSRNLGAKVARGTYVCFLDCDDLWEKDYLQEVKALLEIEKAKASWGFPRGFVDQKGNLVKIKKPPKESFPPLLFGGRVGYPSGSCFHRASFLTLGGYKGQFLMREDWEIFLRFYLSGEKVVFSPTLPYLIREHLGRSSKDNPLFLEATLRVYKEYFSNIPQEYKPVFLHHLAVQCLRYNRKGCAIRFLKEGGWKALRGKRNFWEIFKRIVRFY